MFTTHNRRSGFTLLEVMLAVFMLAIVAISIYRFVQTTLFAVRVTSLQVRETELMEAFARYMRSLMQSFPPTRPGVISGEPHKFSELSQDELRWITGPGSALLTRNADGDWTVTLTIKKNGVGVWELGVWRQDIDAKNERLWLPLLTGVNGLEVRYYDSRSQQWVEKWADAAARPALVRVKLFRVKSNDPYEVVLPLSPVTAGAKPPDFNNNPAQPPMPGVLPGSVPGGAPNARPGAVPNAGMGARRVLQ